MAGTIKAQVQLGDSVTATQNFTITSEASDGTMKIARGNKGATTQDVMTVDAAGKVSFPQNTVIPQIKAWCNFNGATAGTNAPRAGYNVTNITKNSAGDYTINFTTALADANYVVSGSIASNVTFSSTMPIVKSTTQTGGPVLKSTTQCEIITPNYSGAITDNVTEIYLMFVGA